MLKPIGPVLADVAFRSLPAYTVKADRETGEWLGVPKYVTHVTPTWWHSRIDTPDAHFDTFERDGETCAIEVEWV